MKYDMKSLEWDAITALTEEHHIMIGGATGSGKSTLLYDILYRLVQYPVNEQEIYLIDPKRVELVQWLGFPHVKGVATEPEEFNSLLDRVIVQMEARYKYMAEHGQRQSMCPHWHVIIDELPEVLRVKGAVDRIDRILRLGRAANIHLVMATQNPSRNKDGGIPARIWQNVSCRIALHCTTAIESRQCIMTPGAELLPRYGKMYVLNANGKYLCDVPRISEEDVDIMKMIQCA